MLVFWSESIFTPSMSGAKKMIPFPRKRESRSRECAKFWLFAVWRCRRLAESERQAALGGLVFYDVAHSRDLDSRFRGRGFAFRGRGFVFLSGKVAGGCYGERALLRAGGARFARGARFFRLGGGDGGLGYPAV